MRNVSGLLVQSNGKTLLVFKRGFWFFPGGKQEGNEEPKETLLRELREELHLVCRKLELTLLHSGAFRAPEGEFWYNTFGCGVKALSGMIGLDPRDSVTDWGWIDNPLELNLTGHARFILERQWESVEAAI